MRLISIKVEENPSDLDWEDIVSILGLNCHRDSLRKAAAVTDYSGYKVMQYYKDKMAKLNHSEDDDYANELDEKKRALIRERQKLQVEKAEYNRWLREHSRDDLFEEKVIQAIEKNLNKSNIELPDPTFTIPRSSDRVGVLSIADCHFGKEFKVYGLQNEVINEYSPEIFYERMNRLSDEVIQYGKKEGLDSIKIFNLGDSLEGFIRHSQAWSLRYGVVESAILFGEYMGKWLNRLSFYFNIEYYQTFGNHGELRLLDGRKGQHTNENIEMITGHIIHMLNKDNRGFVYVYNTSGLIFSEMCGFNVMGIHGEVKSLEQAIKDYSNIYNVRIDYLFAGHKHYSEYSNCGVRKGVIGIGSIMGSDSFAINNIRKISDATASLVIFEAGKGKVDEHTFVLN